MTDFSVTRSDQGSKSFTIESTNTLFVALMHDSLFRWESKVCHLIRYRSSPICSHEHVKIGFLRVLKPVPKTALVYRLALNLNWNHHQHEEGLAFNWKAIELGTSLEPTRNEAIELRGSSSLYTYSKIALIVLRALELNSSFQQAR